MDTRSLQGKIKLPYEKQPLAARFFLEELSYWQFFMNMLKYIQHPCHITYIGYVMPEKERANMRKFFIKKYKTLILFSYISSAFLTLMFVLNVIIDVPYAGKSDLCLTISYINIVFYVLNYNCLCKRRKIDKNRSPRREFSAGWTLIFQFIFIFCRKIYINFFRIFCWVDS